MIEDKLTSEERVRLEALNQAVNSFVGIGPSHDIILSRAKKFEAYILAEEEN
jgi:hypothetical protein